MTRQITDAAIEKTMPATQSQPATLRSIMEGRLFRVWHTVLEMLNDRGYIVKPELLAYDEAQFELLCPDRNAMTLHVLHTVTRERQLRVIFVDRTTIGATSDGKIRKHSIFPLMKLLGEREGTQGLFVFADDLTLTPAAAKLLEALNEESPGLLQWFFDEELVVNVVGITRRYYTHPARGQKARSTDVGRLYELDRVARHYNAQPETLVRIVRGSETAGVTVSYKRIVPLIDRGDAKNYL